MALGLLALCAGCPVTTSLPTKAPIEERAVRDTGAKYYLYVPSRYTPQRAWPLVVLCHGTKPYDTAWLEMREWAQFAEDHGIIVVAPDLAGVRGDFPPKPPKQIELQRQDERTILGTVSAVRASHRIAEERIFITGWSGGGYAVLFTGLRNPDVFRALAVRQGTFDAAFLADTAQRIDRWQPVYVYYGAIDPVNTQCEQAIAWLRDQGMWVKELCQPGTHRRQPVSLAWDFFKDVFENRPWIRVIAVFPDPREPRLVHFSLKAVPEALSANWNFGDGRSADALKLSHTYETDGTYTVIAKVKLKGGKTFQRTLTVRAPRMHFGGGEAESDSPASGRP